MEPGDYPAVVFEDNRGQVFQRSQLLGLEKLCKGCLEFWPWDLEFFQRNKNRTFHSMCKACLSERAKVRLRRSHKKRRDDLQTLREPQEVSAGS